MGYSQNRPFVKVDVTGEVDKRFDEVTSQLAERPTHAEVALHRDIRFFDTKPAAYQLIVNEIALVEVKAQSTVWEWNGIDLTQFTVIGDASVINNEIFLNDPNTSTASSVYTTTQNIPSGIIILSYTARVEDSNYVTSSIKESGGTDSVGVIIGYNGSASETDTASINVTGTLTPLGTLDQSVDNDVEVTIDVPNNQVTSVTFNGSEKLSAPLSADFVAKPLDYSSAKTGGSGVGDIYIKNWEIIEVG